jgi:hypothetical protein
VPTRPDEISISNFIGKSGFDKVACHRAAESESFIILIRIEEPLRRRRQPTVMVLLLSEPNDY